MSMTQQRRYGPTNIEHRNARGRSSRLSDGRGQPHTIEIPQDNPRARTHTGERTTDRRFRANQQPLSALTRS